MGYFELMVLTFAVMQVARAVLLTSFLDAGGTLFLRTLLSSAESEDKTVFFLRFFRDDNETFS